jgi:hypothetical protein
MTARSSSAIWVGKLSTVAGGSNTRSGGRAGRYAVRRLIERRGRDGKLIEWKDEITADCPRKKAANYNDQCAARCPDLPRVL